MSESEFSKLSDVELDSFCRTLARKHDDKDNDLLTRGMLEMNRRGIPERAKAKARADDLLADIQFRKDLVRDIADEVLAKMMPAIKPDCAPRQEDHVHYHCGDGQVLWADGNVVKIEPWIPSGVELIGSSVSPPIDSEAAPEQGDFVRLTCAEHPPLCGVVFAYNGRDARIFLESGQFLWFGRERFKIIFRTQKPK